MTPWRMGLSPSQRANTRPRLELLHRRGSATGPCRSEDVVPQRSPTRAFPRPRGPSRCAAGLRAGVPVVHRAILVTLAALKVPTIRSASLIPWTSVMDAPGTSIGVNEKLAAGRLAGIATTSPMTSTTAADNEEGAITQTSETLPDAEHTRRVHGPRLPTHRCRRHLHRTPSRGVSMSRLHVLAALAPALATGRR